MGKKKQLFITAKQLEEEYACYDAVEQFKAEFGKRASVTPRSLMRAIKLDMDVEWVGNRFLRGEYMDRYNTMRYRIYHLSSTSGQHSGVCGINCDGCRREQELLGLLIISLLHDQANKVRSRRGSSRGWSMKKSDLIWEKKGKTKKG